MTSAAATIEEYLAELPDDRRTAIEAVRNVILANLPEGYQEHIQYGMIGYSVPHSLYPAGYHCDPKQPLPFVGLANQKNHMAVYLFGVYCDPAETEWFKSAYVATGKKMDMGASCVRFKKLENLPLELVGEAVARMPVDRMIAAYERAIPASKGKR